MVSIFPDQSVFFCVFFEQIPDAVKFFFSALLQHRRYKIFIDINGKEKGYMLNTLNN